METLRWHGSPVRRGGEGGSVSPCSENVSISMVLLQHGARRIMAVSTYLKKNEEKRLLSCEIEISSYLVLYDSSIARATGCVRQFYSGLQHVAVLARNYTYVRMYGGRQ